MITTSILLLSVSLAAHPDPDDAVELDAAAGDSPRSEVGDELSEIIVVSRLDSPRFDIGASAEVDPATLSAQVPASAEDALRNVPGVTIYRPGGAGGVSELMLRGAESNFVATFVDGIRQTEPTGTRGGGFDFSTLGAFEIGGIDVAMGPISALFGSESMAGVVRVYGHRPAAGVATLHAEAGTYDQSDHRLAGALAAELGNSATVALRATRDRADGAIAGGRFALDTASAYISDSSDGVGSEWTVYFRHAERQRSSFPEAGGGPLLAVSNELETAAAENNAIFLGREWLAGRRTSSRVSLAWSEHTESSHTPAIAAGVLAGQPAYAAWRRYRNLEALLATTFAPDQRTELAFGINARHERGSEQGEIDFGAVRLPTTYRLSRTSTSLFAEFGRSLTENLDVVVAARLDLEDTRRELTYRLGAGRSFANNKFRLWGRLATGFKRPGFFALGNALFGNRNLADESVRSVEIGLDYDAAAGKKFALSAFSSDFTNLVDFDFENFTHVNRGHVVIRGIDLRAYTRLTERIRLRGSIVVANGASDSGRLRRRPEVSGRVVVDWDAADAWNLRAGIDYIGNRLTTSIPTGDVVDPGYFATGLSLTYRATDSIRWWLAIDNLADSDYQEAPGFPAPGRRFRLGVSANFQALR